MLISLSILSVVTSCDCGEHCDGNLYTVEATIYFINETSVTITNDFADILPNSTAVMKEERTMERHTRPTVDDYSPGINTRTFFYKVGDTLLCEFGASDITNYENRKEVDDLFLSSPFASRRRKRLKRRSACNLAKQPGL